MEWTPVGRLCLLFGVVGPPPLTATVRPCGARHASHHQPVLIKPEQAYVRRQKINPRMRRLGDPCIACCRNGHRRPDWRSVILLAPAHMVPLAGAVVLRYLAWEPMVSGSPGATGPQAERKTAQFLCGTGRTRRCIEWRPRIAAWQFGSRRGAAIGELNRSANT